MSTYTILVAFEKAIGVVRAVTFWIVFGCDLEKVSTDVREAATIGHFQGARVAVYIVFPSSHLVRLRLSPYVQRQPVETGTIKLPSSKVV